MAHFDYLLRAEQFKMPHLAGLIKPQVRVTPLMFIFN
jgi:hypothetical protein